MTDLRSATLPFDDHDHRDCVATALSAAAACCAARHLQMTPVRKQVLEILLESHKAMGAYDVLDRLRAEGRAAQPPTAYRALAFLTENGFAHRIESLNAFVACARPGSADHDPAFLICTGCGRVAEDEVPDVPGIAEGFRVDHVVVEAEGLCPACQDEGAT